MLRFLLLIIPFFSIQEAEAIKIDPEYYIYPVEDVDRLYSANFGELRPNHFHAGVDIKTNGVEGKCVVAVADGYVSRLVLSPTGYGLAIYITHPNGTTSVCGHLSRFRDDIANYVESERYRTKQHAISLYLTPDQFPVKQGDLVAYSGNTGSSSGPHVHYEIRESASQKPINVFSKGIIKPRDTRNPLIFRIHYVEVDSVGGVCYSAPRRTYEAKSMSEAGVYELNTPNNEIEVGRKGYFIAEMSDRKDDVTNTFGIYAFQGAVDGDRYFEYRMDGFTFDCTRFVNVISCYDLRRNSRNEILIMARPECGTTLYYPTIKNRGIVTCAQGESREIEMIATDDCGLKSTLKFNIKGGESSYKADIDSTLRVVKAQKPFIYSQDGISVSIPARALYQSMPFRCEEITSRQNVANSSVSVVSPIYKILDESIPLHTAMTLSIDVTLPKEDQPKASIAKVGTSGKAFYVGGKYEGGKVSVNTRSTGEYLVVVDKVAPKVVPNFVEGADLTSRTKFTISVSDNYAGVGSYNAYIDGEWIALNYKAGVLTHTFRSQPTASEHTLKVVVSDNRNNTTSVERKFKR